MQVLHQSAIALTRALDDPEVRCTVPRVQSRSGLVGEGVKGRKVADGPQLDVQDVKVVVVSQQLVVKRRAPERRATLQAGVQPQAKLATAIHARPNLPLQ